MKIFVQGEMWRGLINNVTASKNPPPMDYEDDTDEFGDNGVTTFEIEMED